MATATIYLYEDPTLNYSIYCWADRSFSRGRAIVRKTTNTSSTSVGTVVTAGSITAGSLISMPNSNTQDLVFSYANLSKYKINISAATLYVTLASNVSFDSITVSGLLYSNPVYNTEYSGLVDLSNINTTDKTITATLAIDPLLSEDVLWELGGYSWSVHSEAKPNYDLYYYLDTSDNSTYWYRYYYDGTGVERAWCSAKVTNVYLVVTYEEDTSVVVDCSTAIAILNVGVSNKAKKISDIFVGINGKAKKISDAWIGINGIARKIWPCLTLKDMPIGSIVLFDENNDGTLAEYIIVAQNHYLNDINTEEHTVLMRKCVLDTTSRYGDNTYGESYVDEALDKYVNETWKTALSEQLTTKLMNITIPCTKWVDPYKTTALRLIWVPARGELDSSFSERYEAVCFPYFETITTNANRIAYNEKGAASAWWTRSCVEGTSPYVRVVNISGGYANFSQTNSIGVRPTFCLPNSLPVLLTVEGQYDLIL